MTTQNMDGKPLFSRLRYFKKAVNTFCPRWIFGLSPWKGKEKIHWGNQDAGQLHGYDKYNIYDPRIGFLIKEVGHLISKDDTILDLGCNCGLYLSELRNAGYCQTTGVDISPSAISYGRKHFGFRDEELILGSFDVAIPLLQKKGKRFILTYSMGATLELVHPSYDVVRGLCNVTDKYVVLIISKWGHRYPRFWEYEFNRQGFNLVTCITPWDDTDPDSDPATMNSLLIFRRSNFHRTS